MWVLLVKLLRKTRRVKRRYDRREGFVKAVKLSVVVRGSGGKHATENPTLRLPRVHLIRKGGSPNGEHYRYH